MKSGVDAERLFTRVCERHFLQGFVFHSPKYYAPSEREAGDVVLWVRDIVVVVELLTRGGEPGASTRRFVQRIGEKRSQLLKDYNAFKDESCQIQLVNELGETVPHDTRDLGIHFHGIVIVDHDGLLEKPHYCSIKKTLGMPFPVAVMTSSDFETLLSEIDTITDLSLYLDHRHEFTKTIYADHAGLFLDLNRGFERQLIAFYKLNDNKFDTSVWDPEDALRYTEILQATLGDAVTRRNEENALSHVIDDLADQIRRANKADDSTLLHAWELAILMRRQRAGWLAETIHRAFDEFDSGRPTRQFAFYNQLTGCWLVFYFQNGGDLEGFRRTSALMTIRKMIVERRDNDFQHSVFGYGFYKSPIVTSGNVDAIRLTIEDAHNYKVVDDTDYQEAKQFFGRPRPKTIKEFPQ